MLNIFGPNTLNACYTYYYNDQHSASDTWLRGDKIAVLDVPNDVHNNITHNHS